MTELRRRYSDDEVALILRKAAQLDAGPGSVDVTEGLSLADIERIAQEVGIAPDAVARAAALLGADTPSPVAQVFGGPTDFRAEHQARGTLPREAFGDVVASIRRFTGKPGKTSEVLNGLEWKSMGETTQITVIVRPTADRTAVQILADRSGSALITYLFTGMGTLVAGAVTGAIIDPNVGHGLLIMGTAATVGLLTARTIWATATRRFRRTFSGLVNAVTSEVERLTVSPSRDDTP